MRAVAYRMRVVLRARWRATVTLGLIVAAVAGVVLAFAAGADRPRALPTGTRRRAGVTMSVRLHPWD